MSFLRAARSPLFGYVSERARRIAHRLFFLQARRPLWVVSACALVAVLALFTARRLDLLTAFDQLLPESQPSVVEYRKVEARMTGLSKVFVVLEKGDRTTLRRLGDRVAAHLGQLGAPAVVSAQDGVHEARNFLLPRAGLFATIEQLASLRDELRERWNDSVGRALGIDFVDEEPSQKLDLSKLRQIAGPASAFLDRYPDGYFESQTGDALVVVAHTGIRAGDLSGARAALSKIKDAVALEASQPDFSAVHVGYAGDLVTGLSEYGAVRDDLIHVGALGVGLVLAIILLYFGRADVLLSLGSVILLGCTCTFALTRLTIGHLNVVTGFLFSIIAGNGINAGIIYLSRYREERALGRGVAQSIRAARRETWLPTLTASAAASAAYSALALSDFRGLKHFALIGGAGMLICWAATYVLLPAVLMLMDRGRPFRTSGFSVVFGGPFAKLVGVAPRTLAIVGVSASVLGSTLVTSYFRGDPMEYDMKRLFNQVGSSVEQKRLSTVARDIIGIDGESSMALACDRADQVPRLAAALRARRELAPEGKKPFEAVHTLGDLVPSNQAAKLPLLRELRALLLRAHAHGGTTEDDWQTAKYLVPPEDVKPFAMNELPATLAAPFTEKNGTRGLLVYIEPTHGEDEDDAHYLIRWADSFRETRISDSETIYGSGRVVLFADMLRVVLGDVPKVTVLAFSLTALTVIVSTGLGWESFVVLGGLLIGVAWVFLLVVVLRVKLNFLNFIALPITFGIGVDYAVNIVRRYAERRSEGAQEALRSTGGAVVLCSMTTILGYLALLGSQNQAVHSLGMLAVFGEVCCLLAATLVVPALLVVFDRRAGRARVEPETIGHIVSRSSTK